MEKQKKYEIGGTVYVQRPLVLGQIRQLSDVLGGVTLPGDATPAGVLLAVSERLPMALAVVLTPEGVSLRSKELKALAEEIEFSISSEQIVEVVEDFFDCNPVASVLQKLAGAMGAVAGKTIPTAGAGSTILSAPSPEEISPGETKSCGDTPLTNADPT
jgi:hypothetical protein